MARETLDTAIADNPPTSHENAKYGLAFLLHARALVRFDSFDPAGATSDLKAAKARFLPVGDSAEAAHMHSEPDRLGR